MRLMVPAGLSCNANLSLNHKEDVSHSYSMFLLCDLSFQAVRNHAHTGRAVC